MKYTLQMLVLCADTTGVILSFTLLDSVAGLVHSEDFPSEGRMNEFFFTGLERFLSRVSSVMSAQVSVNSVDRLVSVTGPGSFTGIRIGIAAFAGIASGTGAEHIGLGALDAAALLSEADEITIAVKLRMKEYALRSYKFSTQEFSRIGVREYDNVPDDILLIGRDIKGLSRAIADQRCDLFYGNTDAIYVKKSEAEINFHKRHE